MDYTKPNGRILFDVSALVQWYSFFKNPIGIPRVTQKILSSKPVLNNSRVEMIARGPGSRKFYRVPNEIVIDLASPRRRRFAIARLRGLYARSMMLGTLRDLWREIQWAHLPYALLALMRLSLVWEYWCAGTLRYHSTALSLIKIPAEGDIIINLGDFWSQRYLVDALIALKGSSGAVLVQMVHDLFPLQHPESIHPLFSKIWREQFERLAPLVDRWLTNSCFVAKSLSAYLETRTIDVGDIRVVPMGSDSFDAIPSAAHAQDEAILARFGLANRRYLLHVGTIEARKNIIPLLDALTLVRRRHSAVVPALVLVGAAGWKSDIVRKRLKATESENGTVLWLPAVSDAELPAIYRSAQFAIIPGILEGWGLPVRESLMHGVPCIVSNAGALPESGRDLVMYFDPNSEHGLADALEKWVIDSDLLGAARRTLAKELEKGLAFPSWSDAGRVVIEVAAGSSKSH